MVAAVGDCKDWGRSRQLCLQNETSHTRVTRVKSWLHFFSNANFSTPVHQIAKVSTMEILGTGTWHSASASQDLNLIPRKQFCPSCAAALLLICPRQLTFCMQARISKLLTKFLALISTCSKKVIVALYRQQVIFESCKPSMSYANQSPGKTKHIILFAALDSGHICLINFYSLSNWNYRQNDIISNIFWHIYIYTNPYWPNQTA